MNWRRENLVILIFLVLVAAMIALALYGWWTGAWNETPP